MATAADTLDGSHVLLVGTAEWIAPLADALETHGSSVRTVATADAATAVLDDHPIECVVSEHALDGRTGLDLLRTIRDETATLPVVLCTAAGSEAVASEAIAAGVTDYVAVSDPFESIVEDVLARLGQAIRTADRTDTRRDRARQFDATFHDDRTATWVLDPDGSLRRVNSAARELIGADAGSVVGEPFWTLPWWSGTDRTRAAVERTIQHAIDGRFDSSTVSREREDGTSQTLDLSARPVRDETGAVVSIVVEGVDVTERVSLERDLRESEELHRVTLNNMTDTVLITDDDGAFTYVCPNVHFIFGYTAEEIHDLGSIAGLLGPDLFDRDELAAEGVLKNIECTATDKAGREHTLLVNVREVSIQDGTLLYSCRDITKRKRREEALAGLHTTTRELQYAGTTQEIAQVVVDDAATVLDLDASAVYLFDADENALEPVAVSNGMERLDGPLPTRRADDETIPGHTFVADDARFFDDVHDADRLANEATGIRSGAYIPLGEHGVFIAAAGTVGAFDEILRELTDLLAATAEAALDRVERESRLREQERELQRRNAQLTRLDGLNEIIREIDGALVRAETREEIDRAVCELLTAEDRFAFAWIGDADPTTETLEPRAWAGAEQGYLDSVSFSIGTSEAEEPAGRAAATRELQTVSNVADRLREAPWRSAAITREYLSVLSVPLAHDDFEYGVLTVYAGTANAFDGTARAVLAELGETIASATSAIERKNALLTTANTRLEFETRDSAFVFARLARRSGCSLTYEGGVQRTTDGVYVFVSVTNAAIEDVVAAARNLVSIDEVERIGTDDEAGVLRLRLSQPFLALDLADHGAVLRRATADGETATLVVDVPNSVDVRRIDRLVAEAFADVELLSKRSVDRASSRDLHAAFLDRLTDRQLEVLQTAYYSGYFESPRESTGEEIAATLEISPPAFYRHARTVQRKLFTTLFDDIGVPSAATAD
ncbi:MULTISPECIES: bacterio-opsin activator domain-containing protein [Halococcus]|uniref:Putative PAS/PAC sensor protein n=1 Tax=Halococcus salifodinae DSM 8989 TaxID=1227456 RepID=M0N0A5_9EURY|nr:MULTISPECIES: bacterio-opsin activator domain-containing protein [Halococcus]EMA50499.1 putative PAS/PAC sensor protein [Halococcus salifodinae DSM 8989]